MLDLTGEDRAEGERRERQDFSYSHTRSHCPATLARRVQCPLRLSPEVYIIAIIRP